MTTRPGEAGALNLPIERTLYELDWRTHYIGHRYVSFVHFLQMIVEEYIKQSRSLLGRVQLQFDLYAEHHRAKTPPDVEKAERNEQWVAVIQEFLDAS